MYPGTNVPLKELMVSLYGGTADDPFRVALRSASLSSPAGRGVSALVDILSSMGSNLSWESENEPPLDLLLSGSAGAGPLGQPLFVADALARAVWAKLSPDRIRYVGQSPTSAPLSRAMVEATPAVPLRPAPVPTVASSSDDWMLDSPLARALAASPMPTEQEAASSKISQQTPVLPMPLSRTIAAPSQSLAAAAAPTFAARVLAPSKIDPALTFRGRVQEGRVGQNRYGSTARNELLALFG